MKYIIWFWLPPLGYMAAIFSVSAFPNPHIGGETPDYVLHALEYFLLALLLIRLLLTLPGHNRSGTAFLTWQQACLLGLGVAVCYGISDEVHQYFIPNRHCSLHDVFADALGAAVACGMALLDQHVFANQSAWLEAIRGRTRLYALSYAAYRKESS